MGAELDFYLVKKTKWNEYQEKKKELEAKKESDDYDYNDDSTLFDEMNPHLLAYSTQSFATFRIWKEETGCYEGTNLVEKDKLMSAIKTAEHLLKQKERVLKNVLKGISKDDEKITSLIEFYKSLIKTASPEDKKKFKDTIDILSTKNTEYDEYLVSEAQEEYDDVKYALEKFNAILLVLETNEYLDDVVIYSIG